MSFISQDNLRDYQNNGYTILDNPSVITEVKKLKKHFIDYYYNPEQDPSVARAKIKLFSGSIKVQEFIIRIHEEMSQIHEISVRCGPTVTHFTSNNAVGSSFGLPWHQDWPSMASSKNSIVAWTSLTPSDRFTHGLEVVPSSHQNGVASGRQTEQGYLIDNTADVDREAAILNLPEGGLVLFSSFLIHRTFVNPKFDGYKIAFSQRFDDMGDENWKNRGYPNAYKTSVDRELFLK